jgi:hypothetical protein
MKEKYDLAIREMKEHILEFLSDKENGMGFRKWYISKETGIQEGILTVLLKQMKDNGDVELIQIFSEETGLADGRGYCLSGKLNWK